jgi:hypothetical protein
VSFPRTEVVIGTTTIHAAVLDDEDLDAFLDDAQRVRDAGEIALMRRMPRRENHEDAEIFSFHLEIVVESVGECAAVPLAALDGSVEFEPLPIHARRASLLGVAIFPALLGSPATIRYLASYADELPPDDAIVESRLARIDYREFAAMLRGDESTEQVVARLTGPNNRRAVFVYGIGTALATGHQNGGMMGDAHEGNFMLDASGRAVIIDHDGWFRFGPGTSAQCATDFAPLLPGFSAADWSAFRLGYLTTWPEGRRVIDLVEFGDTTGWMNALHTKDFPSAVALLNRALAECPPSDEEARMVLLANRAYARSRNHEPATADVDAALELFARSAPEFVPLLMLHAAVTRSLAGEHNAATQLALALALSPCPPIIGESAVRVAEHAANGRVVTDLDLPFLGRRGNDLVVVPTTEWHVGRP